jgi:hypothetical protein
VTAEAKATIRRRISNLCFQENLPFFYMATIMKNISNFFCKTKNFLFNQPSSSIIN